MGGRDPAKSSARSRQNHTPPLDLNQDVSIIIQGFEGQASFLLCSKRQKGGRFSLWGVNKLDGNEVR